MVDPIIKCVSRPRLFVRGQKACSDRTLTDNDKTAVAIGKAKSFRSEVAAFKRRRIIEEACRLFYERGYTGTTLDDIVAALNATKPLIYSHFKNKGELLYEICLTSTMQSLDVARAASEEGTPTERLVRIVRGIVRVTVQNQANLAVQIREEKQLASLEAEFIRNKQKELNGLIRKTLHDGVAQGEFTSEDPHLAALAIGGMVTWTYYWYRPNGRLSEDELAEGMGRVALQIAGSSALGFSGMSGP